MNCSLPLNGPACIRIKMVRKFEPKGVTKKMSTTETNSSKPHKKNSLKKTGEKKHMQRLGGLTALEDSCKPEPPPTRILGFGPPRCTNQKKRG